MNSIITRLRGRSRATLGTTLAMVVALPLGATIGLSATAATAAVFLTNRGARDGMVQAFRVLFAAVRGKPLTEHPPSVREEKQLARTPVED